VLFWKKLLADFVPYLAGPVWLGLRETIRAKNQENESLINLLGSYNREPTIKLGTVMRW